MTAPYQLLRKTSGTEEMGKIRKQQKPHSLLNRNTTFITAESISISFLSVSS